MSRTVRKVRRSICVALIGLTASMNAAATTYCEGLVTHLGVDSEGQLLVSVNNYGVWNICNLKSAFSGNGVNYAPETCRAWYAAVLSAQKTGSLILFYFSTSTDSYNGPACAAIGSWVVPNPSPYYMLSK